MSKEQSDETDALTQKQYRVSNIASEVVEILLRHFDTEEAYNNREGFEENLLGEMYGRMVVAHMLRYDPVAFAEDAEAASDRIRKLVEDVVSLRADINNRMKKEKAQWRTSK